MYLPPQNQDPACHRDNAKKRLRGEEVCLCGFCQLPRQTARAESDVWAACSKELTLAHHSPEDSVFLRCRFAFILVVVVACQSRSDTGLALFMPCSSSVLSAKRVVGNSRMASLCRKYLAPAYVCAALAESGRVTFMVTHFHFAHNFILL